MEVELVDEFLAKLQSPAGVTQRIQGRRPRANAHHVRYNDKHRARNSRFGRYSDLFLNQISAHHQMKIMELNYLECELTAVVVHSAAVHQAQDIPDAVGSQDLLLGDGTDATVGQCRRHRGHRLAVGLQRAALLGHQGFEYWFQVSLISWAYLEVKVHALAKIRLLGVAAVLPHVEAEGVVSVGGFSLGQEDRVVEAESVAASQFFEVVHGEVELLGQRHFRFDQGLQQGADQYGARVYHRIVWLFCNRFKSSSSGSSKR